MGLMIDGVYHAEDPGPDTTAQGAFRRADSTIRNWITRDGRAGPQARGILVDLQGGHVAGEGDDLRREPFVAHVHALGDGHLAGEADPR